MAINTAQSTSEILTQKNLASKQQLEQEIMQSSPAYSPMRASNSESLLAAGMNRMSESMGMPAQRDATLAAQAMRAEQVAYDRRMQQKEYNYRTQRDDVADGQWQKEFTADTKAKAVLAKKTNLDISKSKYAFDKTKKSDKELEAKTAFYEDAQAKLLGKRNQSNAAFDTFSTTAKDLGINVFGSGEVDPTVPANVLANSLKEAGIPEGTPEALALEQQLSEAYVQEAEAKLVGARQLLAEQSTSDTEFSDYAYSLVKPGLFTDSDAKKLIKERSSYNSAREALPPEVQSQLDGRVKAYTDEQNIDIEQLQSQLTTLASKKDAQSMELVRVSAMTEDEQAVELESIISGRLANIGEKDAANIEESFKELNAIKVKGSDGKSRLLTTSEKIQVAKRATLDPEMFFGAFDADYDDSQKVANKLTSTQTRTRRSGRGVGTNNPKRMSKKTGKTMADLVKEMSPDLKAFHGTLTQITKVKKNILKKQQGISRYAANEASTAQLTYTHNVLDRYKQN